VNKLLAYSFLLHSFHAFLCSRSFYCFINNNNNAIISLYSEIQRTQVSGFMLYGISLFIGYSLLQCNVFLGEGFYLLYGAFYYTQFHIIQ
jgi:hypothetical protein